MFTNKKSKNNHGSGNQNNPNQGNQGNNRGNQGNNQGNQGNQGYQGNNRGNQNQGYGNQNAGRGYQGKNPRGGKYNPPQGGPTSSSDSAGQNQDINDYDVDSSDILNLPDVVSCISHVDTLPPLIGG